MPQRKPSIFDRLGSRPTAPSPPKRQKQQQQPASKIKHSNSNYADTSDGRVVLTRDEVLLAVPTTLDDRFRMLHALHAKESPKPRPEANANTRLQSVHRQKSVMAARLGNGASGSRSQAKSSILNRLGAFNGDKDAVRKKDAAKVKSQMRNLNRNADG